MINHVSQLSVGEELSTHQSCPSPSSNETGTVQTKSEAMLKLGYARVSTLNDEQTTSIESQKKRLEEFGCEQVYSDRLTGGDFDRAGFLELKSRALSAVCIQTVQVVITDGGRFGRDQIEWLLFVEEMQKAGVDCWSLDEGEIDLNAPANRLYWSIKSAFWEYQRLETKGKIINAAERRRNENRRMGGSSPFGYRWKSDNSQLEPDPERWEIARQLVTRYIQGIGLISLESWLKTEYDIVFRSTSILTWLRNPVIQGHTRYRQVRGQKQTEIHFNTHKSLITPSETKELEYRIQNNQFHGPRKHIRAASRLCRCVTCQNRLKLCKSSRFGHTYWHFRCSSSTTKKCPHSGVIRYERVEPLILEKICAKAELLANAVLEPEKEIENPEVLAKQLELAEYQSLHKRNPRPELQRIINDIQREIVYLQSQKQQLQINARQRDELIEGLAQPEFWESLTEAERNQIYTEIGITVWCQGNQILDVELF